MVQTGFRRCYTLSDAVELTGRRLFAHEWTGFEYSQERPQWSPDELEQAHSAIQKTINALEQQLSETENAISATLDDEENQRLGQKRSSINRRRQIEASKLGLLPQPEILRQTFEAYRRRIEAESAVVDAIQQGKLNVHDGRGRPLSTLVWTDVRFRYYIELSIIVNCKTAGAPRWRPARIDEKELDRWVATLQPPVQSRGKPSADEQLRLFLRQQVRAVEGGTPVQGKAAFRELARKEIPGLTKRMFERLWMEEIPDSWHQPGRRKGKKSIRQSGSVGTNS